MFEDEIERRPLLQPWTILACLILGLSLTRNIDFLAGFSHLLIHFVSITHFVIIVVVGNRIAFYFWRQPKEGQYREGLAKFVCNKNYQGFRDASAAAVVYGLSVSLSRSRIFFFWMTVLFAVFLVDSLLQATALVHRLQPSVILFAFSDIYMVSVGIYMAARGYALQGMYGVILGYTILTAIFDLWNRPKVFWRLRRQREYFKDRDRFVESPVRGHR